MPHAGPASVVLVPTQMKHVGRISSQDGRRRPHPADGDRIHTSLAEAHALLRVEARFPAQLRVISSAAAMISVSIVFASVNVNVKANANVNINVGNFHVTASITVTANISINVNANAYLNVNANGSCALTIAATDLVHGIVVFAVLLRLKMRLVGRLVELAVQRCGSEFWHQL
jgi:hypothetical protein